jgi:hypothetical protein
VTFVLIRLILILTPFPAGIEKVFAQDKSTGAATIKLPAPKYSSDTSVEKALLERRSVRSCKAEPLTIIEIAQILWAAQGITEPKKGMRTAPSARGMYLMEVYLITGNVTNLPAGIYKYGPQGHMLIKIAEGNIKDDLFKAADQAKIKNAPATLLIAGKSAEASGNPQWMYLGGGPCLPECLSASRVLEAWSSHDGRIQGGKCEKKPLNCQLMNNLYTSCVWARNSLFNQSIINIFFDLKTIDTNVVIRRCKVPNSYFPFLPVQE